MNKKSVNQPTIRQLKMACRHVDEMIEEGITMNHAIRLLELFTDVYAKLLNGGSATPHSVDQVKLWSVAAKKWRKTHPNKPPGGNLVVEHGTPRRAFALLVLNLYHKKRLTEEVMNRLVKKYWKLAVITVAEDDKLRKIARSKMYDSPEKRWDAAGIVFS